MNCVTQLMLYTGDKLSSTIFCLWVSVSGIGNTRPNLHFFQYIQAYKPFADHVPPNIKQYQLILTKYQPVSSFTDPVPSSTTYNSSSQRHSSANWIISLFTTHLMSHAEYTWSSLDCLCCSCFQCCITPGDPWYLRSSLDDRLLDDNSRKPSSHREDPSDQ